MAGSPVKHARNHIVREAIIKALEKEGMTPEEALIPIAQKILAQAQEGDVASFKELADRLDGKPAQQVQLQGDADQPLAVELSWLKGRDLAKGG